MSDEYSVTRYSPEHRSSVISLWGRVFHQRPEASARYLAWKYEANPYIADPLMALVFLGDELVAMRGMVGTCWSDRAGKTTILPAAEDLAVDKNHRGRGLFLKVDKKLVQLARDSGYSALLSLSAAAKTRQLQTMTGWRHHASMEIRRPTSAQPFARFRSLTREIAVRLIPRLPSERSISRLLEGFDPTRLMVSESLSGEDLVKISGFRRIAGHDRSSAFYGWRLANPSRRYRVVFLGKEPSAFVVLGWRPSRPRQPSVVDSGAKHPDLLIELLATLVQSSDTDYDIMPTALPTPAQGVLGSLGWAQEETGAANSVEVFIKSVTRGQEPSTRLGRIDLIDTMRF